MTLTTRYPLFSLTASEAAAPRERLAFAMASLCSFACAKSSPWVIGSVLAILPVLSSDVCAQLVGAANTNAAANAAMIPIIFMGEPPVRRERLRRCSAVVPLSCDVAGADKVTLRHNRLAHPPFHRRSTNDQALRLRPRPDPARQHQ